MEAWRGGKVWAREARRRILRYGRAWRRPEKLAPAGSLLAPMPGLVRRVLVEVGALVTAGQPLLVLEAMKMEQTVAAPAAGVVAELRAKAGEQVSTGQVLAVVEPNPAESSTGESSPADE